MAELKKAPDVAPKKRGGPKGQSVSQVLEFEKVNVSLPKTAVATLKDLAYRNAVEPSVMVRLLLMPQLTNIEQVNSLQAKTQASN